MSESKPNAKTQGDKFKDLARELECDESEEVFDEALGRVATAPPPPKDDNSEEEEPAK
ncbi:MAG: hypothetical protein VX529_07415 [Pseudomonadota bacterium]|nr:hypothetical protein [Pseudomonadota bacterium]